LEVETEVVGVGGGVVREV